MPLRSPLPPARPAQRLVPTRCVGRSRPICRANLRCMNRRAARVTARSVVGRYARSVKMSRRSSSTCPSTGKCTGRCARSTPAPAVSTSCRRRRLRDRSSVDMRGLGSWRMWWSPSTAPVSPESDLRPSGRAARAHDARRVGRCANNAARATARVARALRDERAEAPCR